MVKETKPIYKLAVYKDIYVMSKKSFCRQLEIQGYFMALNYYVRDEQGFLCREAVFLHYN